MRKKVFLIVIVTIIILMSTIFGSFINKTEAASDEEVYDVILFWGQSNMLGFARGTEENRQIGREENFASETATHIDIVKNIDTQTIDLSTNKKIGRSRVSIDLEPGIAYEYIMYPNSELGCTTADEHLKPMPTGKAYEYVCIGEPLKYNKSTNKVEYVPFKEIDGKNEDVSLTGCMNMIPAFCQGYYYLTGHKVIAVMCAEGGEPIESFTPGIKDGKNIYEVMKQKYNQAVSYAESKNMKIGNKYFVSFQGESNVRDDKTGTTEWYETKYREVVDGLKRDCGITNGALVETGFEIYSATMEPVNRIHTAQENLINNYSDTVLGSRYPYESFVPVDSDYDNCFTNVCYDEKGNKLDYGTAYAKATERVDSNYFETGTVLDDYNRIHFTSAALCQIGVETAVNLALEVTGRITSIELVSTGKTTYTQNVEKFDVNGWKIKVNYSNGKSAILNVTDEMVYNFDNTELGTKQIMIYYHDVAVYPNITIVKAKEEEKEQKQDEQIIMLGDLNKNGRIDIGDILILQRYIAASTNKKVANAHPEWLIIK